MTSQMPNILRLIGISVGLFWLESAGSLRLAEDGPHHKSTLASDVA